MKLGIFCSSKPHLADLFRSQVRDLISSIEASGLVTAFVYGGGDVGLMGLVREYATIPVRGHNLPRWNPLPDEFVYSSLRERQAALIDDSDGYIVLAGGVGTIHELFQVLCENDVEKKTKPIFIYDPDFVYKPLEDLLRNMYNARYIAAPPKVYFVYHKEDLLTSLTQTVSK
jgi:uncharacterized protein (TIGR00730 family)